MVQPDVTANARNWGAKDICAHSPPTGETKNVRFCDCTLRG